MKLKILLAVLSMSISIISYASGSTGYRDISHVQQRECYANKGFQIVLASEHANPDQCSSSIVLEVSCDAPAYETFVSIALAALVANKKVQAFVAGCDSEGQAKVIALTLQK